MELNFLKRFMRSKQYGTIITGLNRISGVDWNDSKYLQAYESSLYVFACVSKIAEEVGNAELQLFQILNTAGDTKEIMVHPALDLIYRVNPFQTKAQFLEITIINLKLVGEAFWFKVRNERGQVMELWNLRPDFMTIVKDPETFIKHYEFTKEDGSKTIFAPEDIVHHKYPSPLDAYRGTSPLKAAAVRVDIEEAASIYQRDFFLNQARPDAVLQFEGNLSPEQKEEIRSGWNDRHQGVKKNSKIGILEGGVKYQQLSISQREMDYIESLKLTRDDILVAYKVPKPIVAITDDVNRANAEAAKEVFLANTIKPELRRLVEQINEMLIYPDFGDTLFLDFEDPTPENREQTLKEYETGLKNGYLVLNEVRQREGMPPMDGGDEPLLPNNLSTLKNILAGNVNQPTVIPAATKAENLNRHNFVLQKNKQALFKGRFMLYTKLHVTEIITKQMNDAAESAKKNATKIAKSLARRGKGRKEIVPVPTPDDKSKYRSMIGDPSVKRAYGEMVVKKLDAQETKFRAAMNSVARGQEQRMIKFVKAKADLEKSITPAKTKGKKKKLTQTDKELADLLGIDFKQFEKFADNERQVLINFSFEELEKIAIAAGADAMDLVQPGAEFNYTNSVKAALKKRSTEFAESVNDTTFSKLTNTLTEGIAKGEGIAELTGRVNATYDDFSNYRSELIARTETTAANNEGFMSAFKQSDTATHKEWIATNDSRTREEHVQLDGEIVPVDQAFSNGLQYPQEPNCRCVIAPAFVEA